MFLQEERLEQFYEDQVAELEHMLESGEITIENFNAHMKRLHQEYRDDLQCLEDERLLEKEKMSRF